MCNSMEHKSTLDTYLDCNRLAGVGNPWLSVPGDLRGMIRGWSVDCGHSVALLRIQEEKGKQADGLFSR